MNAVVDLLEETSKMAVFVVLPLQCLYYHFLLCLNKSVCLLTCFVLCTFCRFYPLLATCLFHPFAFSIRLKTLVSPAPKILRYVEVFDWLRVTNELFQLIEMIRIHRMIQTAANLQNGSKQNLNMKHSPDDWILR